MNEGHYESRKRGKYRCTLKNGHWTKSEHFVTKEPRCNLRALAQGKRPPMESGYFFYRECLAEEYHKVPGLSKWKRYFGGESLRGIKNNIYSFYE